MTDNDAPDYTRWQASQAGAWAMQVKRTCIRLRERTQALEELTAFYDGLRAMRYDKDGGAGTHDPDSALVEAVTRLDSMRAEYAESVAEWRDEVSVFEHALRLIDGRYDAILMARYVRLKTWREIAQAMHYDENYCSSVLHIDALAALYVVMPSSMKTPLPDALGDDNE